MQVYNQTENDSPMDSYPYRLQGKSAKEREDCRVLNTELIVAIILVAASVYYIYNQ